MDQHHHNHIKIIEWLEIMEEKINNLIAHRDERQLLFEEELQEREVEILKLREENQRLRKQLSDQCSNCPHLRKIQSLNRKIDELKVEVGEIKGGNNDEKE